MGTSATSPISGFSSPHIACYNHTLSILPLLILRGVAEAIASRQVPKILILNGSHDRETMYHSAKDEVGLSGTTCHPGRDGCD